MSSRAVIVRWEVKRYMGLLLLGGGQPSPYGTGQRVSVSARWSDSVEGEGLRPAAVRTILEHNRIEGLSSVSPWRRGARAGFDSRAEIRNVVSYSAPQAGGGKPEGGDDRGCQWVVSRARRRVVLRYVTLAPLAETG